MRLAAIDIGTNSIHMIVVQVHPGGAFDVIDREKDMVRLGAGGLDGRALSETVMAAAIQTLSNFRRLAESHRVDEIIAGATSAVREAENGGDFLAAVRRETGLRARVISGTKEARLIHRAACYGAGAGSGPTAVVDIGGGSVELTQGTAATPRLARSYKLGVIRLTERFVRSDPIAPRDARRMAAHIRRMIADDAEEIAKRGVDRVIGCSGTILSLGALAAGDAAAGEVRNLTIPAKQIRRLRKQLVEMPLEERLRLPGLDPRRADLAVAGSILLDTLLSTLGAQAIVLSDLALREGLVLDYVRSHRTTIATVERYPDIRRRSVIELAERSNYAERHSAQVARLALALFDQTREVHGLGDREREWLEYGALLHDAGVHISYKKHHKHSHYLIKHGDLRGFRPDEVQIIGLLARYHRRGRPKKRHADYRDLPSERRRAVRVLSALVRVAEHLDRSHAQVVTGLHVRDRGTDVLIQLVTSEDAELEVWAAHRGVRPLERVLGKPVRLEAAPRPDTEAGRRRRPARQARAAPAGVRPRGSGEAPPAADARRPDDGAARATRASRAGDAGLQEAHAPAAPTTREPGPA